MRLWFPTMQSVDGDIDDHESAAIPVIPASSVSLRPQIYQLSVHSEKKNGKGVGAVNKDQKETDRSLTEACGLKLEGPWIRADAVMKS